MSARERILGAVREAIAGRGRLDRPGPFEGWRPVAPAGSPVDGFAALLEAAGGEVVRLADDAAAAAWLADFALSFESACAGEGVPEGLRPDRPRSEPAVAALGVSMARGAVAETGSLLMGAEDGRRAQLLAPTHVVLVREAEVHTTLREALASMKGSLPSAIGLHSGPSKSADIGQVMVKGVHGPGRLIAAVIGGEASQ